MGEDLRQAIGAAPVVAPAGGERKPRKPARPRGEIFEGCSVKPLGVQGDVSWYLDRHGQLRGIDNHTAQKMLHVFGDRIDELCRAFPQYDKEGLPRPSRFDQTAASMAMIRACSERGLFNPEGSVRGVGAWVDDDGRLVWHGGDVLLTARGEVPPGEIDGKIYPAYAPIPRPAERDDGSEAGRTVLATLERWAWSRADLEPLLALGMVSVQMLCGALQWRPVYWLTGDKASGKSAFQELVRHLHGDRGLIQSSDSTKSGITSRIGHSSLPVAVDELEPGDEGSNKERDIIVLARVAASGGQWLRGSADQKGAGGNVFSSFLFSSILIPGAMGAQDRSRLIVMSLQALPRDAERLSLRPRHWHAVGAMLRRQLIDRWPSWAERLELWRAALERAGLAGRDGDNYATTLAAADAALHAELPARDVLDALAEKVAEAVAPQVADVGSNAADMLQFLLGQPLDIYRRGELFTVAQWLMVAAELPAAPHGLVSSLLPNAPTDLLPGDRAAAAKAANAKLARYGLRVQGRAEAAKVFLPNAPIPELCKLFQRSQWASGVWSQAARRVPGAEPVTHPLTLAGQRTRGVYLPVSAVGGLLALPMDRDPAEPPAAPAGPQAQDWGPDDFA